MEAKNRCEKNSEINWTVLFRQIVLLMKNENGGGMTTVRVDTRINWVYWKLQLTIILLIIHDKINQQQSKTSFRFDACENGSLPSYERSASASGGYLFVYKYKFCAPGSDNEIMWFA